MKKARDYQTGAVKAAVASNCGQIILPTGSGKSFVEFRVINHFLKGGNFNVFIVATPRILLTNQLVGVTAKELLGLGQSKFRLLTVHSGKTEKLYNESDESIDMSLKFGADGLNNQATTSDKVAASRIRSAKEENVPLIIFSTYHSLGRVAKALKATKTVAKAAIFDEAHYLTAEDFHKTFLRLCKHVERRYCFTATRRVIKDSDGYASDGTGAGMNNEQVYGKVLFQRVPKVMIEAGWMVTPRIHSLAARTNTAAGAIVRQAYEKHDSLLQEDAEKSGVIKLVPKLLVSCNGTKELEQIRRDPKFVKWAIGEGVSVMSISSSRGAHIGEDRVERDEWLKTLRNTTKPVIVLHINILTEGIDVPDMTGIVVMRNMEIGRLQQTMGRATRPIPEDIVNGVPKVKGKRKKYAYVIIVVRQDDPHSVDKHTMLKRTVCTIRGSGIAIDLDEIIYDDVEIGIDNKVVLKNTNEIQAALAKEVKKAYDQVTHSIEDEAEIERTMEFRKRTVGLNMAEKVKIAMEMSK